MTEAIKHLKDWKVDWAGIGAISWGAIELMGSKIAKLIESFLTKKIDRSTEDQTTVLLLAVGGKLEKMKKSIDHQHAEIKEDMKAKHQALKMDIDSKHLENKAEFASIREELKRQDGLHVTHHLRFEAIEGQVKDIREKQHIIIKDVSKMDGRLETVLAKFDQES